MAINFMQAAEPVESKPFRYYYSKPEERGVRRPTLCGAFDIVETGVPNSSGARLSADDVDGLLEKHGLEALNLLSESMAHNLQIMKETDHYADLKIEGRNNPMMTLRKAIPSLTAAAAEVAAILKNALATPGCDEVERRRRLLEAVVLFTASSETIMETSRDTGGEKSTAHWHDDAYFLAVELFEEARRVGSPLALSKHDSVGVLAIAGMLDLARVNHSGTDAIAKELNRRRAAEPFLKVQPA